MTRNVLKTLGSIRVALAVAVGLPLLIVSNAFAQAPAATPTTGSNIPPAGGAAAGGQAEVERVIVTGSNIPTAEEVGPNPVDTYRRDDITRLGRRALHLRRQRTQRVLAARDARDDRTVRGEVERHAPPEP